MRLGETIKRKLKAHQVVHVKQRGDGEFGERTSSRASCRSTSLATFDSICVASIVYV